MDIPKKINLKLLTDEPTDIDELESHEKVATTIYEVITGQDVGKSIALIGTWGSGKSSIISMVKNKLSNDCHVFLFNAWAHEGDPLRRSFLESLFQFCFDNNILKEKDWVETLEEISQRREDTETTNFPRLSLYGYLLILIGFLVPLGMVLLTKWPQLSMCYHYLSVSFVLGPFIYALVLFIISRFYKDKNRRDKLLSIFVDKSERRIVSKTYKTKDPTTIEFAQYFVKIFNAIYKKNELKKFLIVVDNLDRIESESALRIWATMKTFFDFDNLKKRKWRNKLWLLVPFDKWAVAKLWGNDENENKGELAYSFVDKTFQIVFETPPSVISNWEKYLKAKFMEAFEGYDDKKEIHQIYRIYSLLCVKENLSPTPRELKLFVNDVVRLYIRWKDAIPLHIQALYVMLRKTVWRSDKEIIKNLLNSEQNFLEPVKATMIDTDFREYLASLYFNIERNKAVHILITEPLKKALLNNDTKSIENLSNYDSFPNILEGIIEENYALWATEDPVKVGGSAETLSRIKMEGSDSIDSCWNILEKGLKSINSYTNLSEYSTDGVIKIIERNKLDVDLQKTVITSLTESDGLFETYDKETEQSVIKKESELKNNIRCIAKILNCLINLGGENIIVEKYALNASASTYNNVMFYAILEDEIKGLNKYLVPLIDTGEIIADLTKRISSGSFYNTNWISVIRLYKDFEIHWDWEEIIIAIKERIENQTKPKPQEISNLIEILNNLS